MTLSKVVNIDVDESLLPEFSLASPVFAEDALGAPKASTVAEA